MAAPLFVDDEGGFQADVVVWLDVTRSLVVALEMLRPDAPEDALAALLCKALAKPLAGPRSPPERLRVATDAHAKSVSAVLPGVPVSVAPVPEADAFLRHMGETMSGASPALADFRTSLRVEKAAAAALVAAAARFFRARPWTVLSDAQPVRLDVPELGAVGACAAVMGQAMQSWGLIVFASPDGYCAVGNLPPRRKDAPDKIDIVAEALSLSFSAAGELPLVIRRELAELGWDLGKLDVFPHWFHSARDTSARAADAREMRLLAAAAVGIVEHVATFRAELESGGPTPRTVEYRVQTHAGPVTAVLTLPHPEIPWPSGPAAARAAKPKARRERGR